MKLDIISGFLGAGKTTFLNKILPELGEKIVIIENEYGDVAVDGSLIEDDLPVQEIMAGCICCSLVIDFQKAIKELAAKYHPHRIIIEPSGVSCLSDVLRACQSVQKELAEPLEIDRLITIVDASAFLDYIDDFGMFYSNQIANANLIFLSHLEQTTDVDAVIQGIKEVNSQALIWSEDWFTQDGAMLTDWLQSALADTELYQPSTNQKRVIFNAHDVFGSWSATPNRPWSEPEIQQLLQQLATGEYGRVLRAKGILTTADNQAINFNYTPYDQEYHTITSQTQGKVAVIGCKLATEKLAELFA